MSRKRVSTVLAIACAGIGCGRAVATPYASQVSLSGNTVTFNLNEAADAVSVKIGGVTTPLLTTTGFQSFNLPSATTPFSIQVDKNSGAGWQAGQVLQVGTDTSTTTFFAPRGVAVNQNPGQYFGRVYVSNDTAGAPVTSGSGVARDANGAGIYILNADQTDAVGQGDTALDPVSGGAWGTLVNTPWHITVGPDNNLYVADAGSGVGSAGTMWRLDPNATSGVNALFGLSGNSATDASTNGHGRIFGSPVVHKDGSGAITVYATDADLDNGSGFNAIQRYDLGTSATAPSAPVPVTLVSNPTAAPNAAGINGVQGVTTDLAQGSIDGRFYFTENRSAGGQPGLFVVNPADGTILWDSLTETARLGGGTTDFLIQTRSVAVSPDNKYVAMITDNNTLNIIPLTLSLDGVDGLPDFEHVIQLSDAFPTATTIGRDIGFDAAGNIYAVSSGNAMMRVFSPGGTTSYTTSFDGTSFAFGVTSTSGIPGDVNHDGIVDLGDVNYITARWLNNGSDGDADGNGVIDLGDINYITARWLNTSEPGGISGALAAVPEPTSFALLTLGAAAPLLRRRRA